MILHGVTAAIVLSTLCLSPLQAAGDRPTFTRGAMIHFEGTITSRLEHYLYRQLDRVQRSHADLLIINIDSPGGEIEASLNVANRLRDLNWARTVAFVPEQALSGAAIVALGCDEIITTPRAVLGDAGPIVMDFLEFGFRHAPEKIQTDLARRLRDLAKSSGRPPALAEAMCDKDLVVYRVKNRATGVETYMSDDEISSEQDPAEWEKLNPVLETREGKFLEVNGRRGLELGLVDAVVADDHDMKQRFRLEQDFIVYRWRFVDTTIEALNSPLVTVVLLVIGLIALCVEFSAPGIGIGGITAALCFALFFWSRFLGGTAEWLEVILFVSGVAFLLVELFILPGFGVAGISGTLLILASLVMASQSFVIPHTGRELASLTTTLLVVLGSCALVFVAAIFMTRYFGEVPVLGRLALRPPTTNGPKRKHAPSLVANDESSEASYHEKRLNEGDIGVASSPLRPAGVARFGDDFQDVVSEGTFIDEGRRVQVIRISGNRIVVREVQDTV